MDRRIMQPNVWLIATSCGFILPYVYVSGSLLGWSSLALSVASSVYHATKHRTFFWVDQIAVFSTLTLTFIHGYNTNTLYIFYPFGVLNSIMYLLGCWKRWFVWSHHFVTATISHAFMHLWTILGVCLMLSLKTDS